MRKTTILTIIMLCTSMIAIASPVDLSQAKTIAKQYLNRSVSRHAARSATALQLAGLRTVQTASNGGEEYPAYYVFNKGKESGFIIVSGDDRMRPVIAETFEGSFDEDDANPNFKWWLDAVAESAEHLATSDDDTLLYIENESSAAVSPLIQTKWGQETPYNNLCPEFDGKRSVTGCVATAMAQVFYYLKYPEVGTGTVKYTSTSTEGNTTYRKNINDDLSKYSFDYDQMQRTYKSTSTGDAADAVARLMYACGIASGMNYSPEGSGTLVQYATLTKNFALDKSCKYASRDVYTSTEWHNLLKSELDEGRPMLYSGQSDTYGGHQFICDGYDSHGRFHFNWGWNGSQDGYYDVDAIMFNQTQDVVYNLKADEGGKDDLSDFSHIWYETMEIANQSLPYTIALDEKFDLNITNFYNMWKAYYCYIGTALYNGKNILRSYINSDHLSAGVYGTINQTSLALPSTLEDGTYALCPVLGYKASNLHPLKYSIQADGAKYLIVSVKDGQATFNDNRKTISTSSNMASFSAPCNVKAPEGVAVYKAKMSSDGNNVVLTNAEANVIPANTGVIVYYEGGGIISFDITEEESTADFSDNELIASTTNPTVPNSGTYYGMIADDASFTQLENGIELSPNESYIMLGSESEAKSINIIFSGDEPSGVSEIHAKSGTVNQSYYTLQGVRVNKPTKGMYIYQGRKIIM